MAAERQNPFLQPYDTKYEIALSTKSPQPISSAIKAGIEEQDRAINAIVMNRATPRFIDNTILPLENLSPILERVAAVFYHYMEALGTPEFAGCPGRQSPAEQGQQQGKPQSGSL